MRIPIEVSARHVHLTQEDYEKLFGKDHHLNIIKKISQPGQFSAEETVNLISENNGIKNVRIVGPFRKNSQVEISITDAYRLKLNPLPKIRISGDILGTTKITIENPENKNRIKIPTIIAQRHLHCSTNEAKKLGLKNKQNISIKIPGKRETIFNKITVRVSPNYKLALHLDTDEGNAAGINEKTYGKIVK